ncbi:LTA synthase family protein [Bacteriovoracaceae bacterium]|nr:LTA synthase family protein [Bacteriovoracaceae bacterium]
MNNIWLNLSVLLLNSFVLKIIRLDEAELGLDWYQVIDFFKIDLFFTFTTIFLTSFLFSLKNKILGKSILFSLFTLYFLLEVCGHSFFMQAGEHLDYNMIVFALLRLNKLLALAQGENSGLFIYFYIIFFIFLFLNFWFPLKIIQNFNLSRFKSSFLTNRIWGGINFILLFVLSVFPNFSQINKNLNKGPFLSSFNFIDYSSFREVNSLPQKYFEMNFSQKDFDQEQKNIVIVVLESTRARSVDPYVNINVTPYFEKIAQEGILAKYAYSVIPHTSKSLVNILCGVYPNITSHIDEAKEGTIKTPCLANVLRNKFYYQTAYFQSATENFESRRSLVSIMGYENFFPLESMNKEGYEKANYFGLEDNVMLPKSKDWLNKVKKSDRPFLATYLTVSPHFHYQPVKRYGQFNFHNDQKYNAYLNALRYQDHFLENLINQYKEEGLFDKTVFIILGDHGETFKIDHGTWGHGDTAYQEGLRVPYLVYNLKGSKPKQISENVVLMDTVPTVLDILGIQVQNSHYHGYSLLQNIPEDRLAYFHGIRPTYAIGVISGKLGLKYIHWYNRAPDRVYNIIKDPYEKMNIANMFNEEKLMQFKQKAFEWKKSVSDYYGN